MEVTIMETTEVKIGEDSVLEFNLAISCDGGGILGEPVHIEYSPDNGVTWYHIRNECIQSAPTCHGYVHPASIIYGPHRWRKYTIPLKHLQYDR